MGTLNIIETPISKYWLSVLRDKTTQAPEFRQACTELSALLASVAFAHLALRERPIETPFETTIGFELAQSVIIVPILRTGHLLVDGVLRLYPKALVLPIGLRRGGDGSLTEYDTTLFRSDETLFCLIVDGIVGTGRTICTAIERAKANWPHAEITAISLIGLRPVLDLVALKYSDVNLVVAACDREIDSRGYILPGVGDIRRRAFNTTNVLLTNVRPDLPAKS